MEILFSDFNKESQKRLIEEAILEQWDVEVKVSNIQVYRDQFFNQMPTGDDDEDVFLRKYHHVYADTPTGTVQLLWNLTDHRFEPELLFRPKKKVVQVQPLVMPEPVKKPKRTPKKVKEEVESKKEKNEVQEDKGNAEAQVS